MHREIIEIDEEKCNGCGDCTSACPEGAIQIIDGKARIVNEAFCDGLGACITHCPENAITIEKRETEPYNEKAVVNKMLKKGKNVLKAHLKHLKNHNQDELLKKAKKHLKEKNDFPLTDFEEFFESDENTQTACCPPQKTHKSDDRAFEVEDNRISSKLSHWPVQLRLVPPNAPHLENSELLIAADCVPFAYPNFHQDFLDGKSVVVGCPKLDDSNYYEEKLSRILKQSDIEKITITHMSVPCCSKLNQIVKRALEKSGKDLPVEEVTINLDGEKEE